MKSGKKVRRRHKQLPVTAQTPLFPGAAEVTSPRARDEAVRFEHPDPERIFIGDTPLRQYLCAHRLEWVIALRAEVEKSDLQEIRQTYSQRGRRPIDPAVLVGLTLYGMLSRQWSLRDLEALAIRDVGAWWICGGLQPDHSTLGYFLHRHAGFLTAEFFLKLTRRFLQELKSRPGAAALDGTVFEAVGSHYQTLKAEAARGAAQEAAAALAAAPEDPRRQKAAEQAQQVAMTAAERTAQREQLGKDPDAVRVCASEPEAVSQPLKNGAVRPAYKPSASANEQRMIVGQYLHPSDEIAAVEPLLQQYQALYGSLPARLLADAGYHCHTVLALSLELDLDVLCPSGKAEHGLWEKRGAKGRLGKKDFRYLPEGDCYLCPAGQVLKPEQSGHDAAGRAYVRYHGPACAACARRGICTKSKYGRTIKRYAGDELKEAMVEVLKQKGARRAYGQRKAMIEPVFAALRERQDLRRFHRRGRKGAALEFGLHCSAYNLRRYLRLKPMVFYLVFWTGTRNASLVAILCLRFLAR